MDSYTHSLPPPTGPLKRQVGVCIDGFPLSPISISRSISNGSHESVDTNDEKTRRHLLRFSNILLVRIRHLEDDISTIRIGLKEQQKTQAQKILFERKVEKEKELALNHKKLKKVRALLELFNEE